MGNPPNFQTTKSHWWFQVGAKNRIHPEPFANKHPYIDVVILYLIVLWLPCFPNWLKLSFPSANRTHFLASTYWVPEDFYAAPQRLSFTSCIDFAWLRIRGIQQSDQTLSKGPWQDLSSISWRGEYLQRRIKFNGIILLMKINWSSKTHTSQSAPPHLGFLQLTSTLFLKS